MAPGTFYEHFRDNKIFLRDDPAGHFVEQAYACSIIQSDPNNPPFTCGTNNPGKANGVTVDGFVIEKAANNAQVGAIDTQAVRGWLVQNNEIAYNHGASVLVDGSTIQSNYIHHNGQIGIDGACFPTHDGCSPDSVGQQVIVGTNWRATTLPAIPLNLKLAVVNGLLVKLDRPRKFCSRQLCDRALV